MASLAKREFESPEVMQEEGAMPFMLPYNHKVSFVSLIQAIEQQAARGGGVGLLAQTVLDKISEVPELLNPIEDINIVHQHQELVDMMFSFVVPVSASDQQLIKIVEPFSKNDLYATPIMKQLLVQNKVHFSMNQTTDTVFCGTLIRAASAILNKFYGQDIAIDPPLQVTVKGEDDVLPSFYKAGMNMDFLDVHVIGDLPLLTQDTIDDLLANIYDVDRWLKALPPSKFEFHGFIVVTLNDITQEEALSQVKHHLLKKDAVLHRANIDELEQLMRVYLGVADLRLGVTAIDYPKENTVAHQYKIRFDFLANDFADLLHEDYNNSIYHRVCKYRNVMLIEDLAKVRNKTALEEQLLAQGLRSAIVATLVDPQDNVIGIVELGSPRPYGLHSFVELQFKEILGLFRTAVRRSREEVDNRIEAIVREKYTALHPSVEWRFIEEAFNILEARDRNEANVKPQPIVFKDVYPIYGQADIVSSSTKRNESIRVDLMTELNITRKVLQKSKDIANFPLVDQVLLHIERELQHLADTYNSSDETRILELIQAEIQPLLKQLAWEYPDIGIAVTNYFDQLDPELGIIYQRRKDYEKSVEAVNDLISSYLDKDNAKMQKTLPHYFERYKTDGVEYDLYIGQSLLQNQDAFSDIHLRNFRLWQLLQMCEVTRMVEQRRHDWPEPLTTAQLIFAYTSPLSIRFRMDEKRFDVDGAYNVRYEILKKRIDKAVIEGTNERITKSGHIAIIYLQEKDRQEYLGYADYLLHHGYITEPPHDYELAALQGVQGLKALRLQVKR